MKKYLFLLLLSSLVVGQSEAASTPMVWWVDHKNGDDSNSGATEVTAVKTVYKAMKNIGWFNGDTIKVKPALNSDGTLHYYDFKNEEINLNTSNNFVLIGTGGADSTIFDARTTNRHFTFDDGQSSETIIKGITFKNGYADNWPGAGSIFLHRELQIQFIDCIWEGNSTNGQEGGGAIIIREGATPSFTGCTFKGNYVNNTDGGDYGGAVRIQWPNSKAELESTVKFKKTKFIDNYLKVKHNAYGGAVASERNVEFENCLFVNNRAITNNGGTGSEAWGGAIYLESKYWNGSGFDGGVMKIVNSTFHGNYIQTLSSSYGDMRGGTINYGRWDDSANSKTYIFNTIVSGSKVLIEQTERVTTGSDYLKNEVIGTGNTSGYKLTLDYSNIQSSAGMSWSGDNTYEVEPVYKDSANGDYSLSDKSPVIGAGVATWSDEGLSAPTEDILGNARPNPSGSNPDMGAYENSNSASTAPLPVSGLTVKRATQGASLSWSVVKESLGSSTDASNIEYQIYQNGTNVAQTTSTSYSVTGLTNGTTYSFTVSAKNTSTGVEGAQSGAKTVIPRYQGPKWYVAATADNGKSLSDTTTNYNLGSSASPINHLSNGIEIAAAGDTIVMKKGTHSGSNNRGIDWNATKSLVIMGEGGDDPSSTIIDAGGRDRHFTFDSGEDTTYQIIGLTLQNGKHTSGTGGGSVSIRSQSSAFFKKVIFKQNKSTSDDWATGGAVYVENSYGLFYDCEFIENENDITANTNDQQARGGAVRINSSNSEKISTFLRCKFSDNIVKANGSAYGGALSIYEGGADIINSLFYNNKTLSAVGSQSNNHQTAGGAIHIRNTSYWSNQGTEFTNNIKIINNTLYGNAVTSEVNNQNPYAGGIAMGTGGKTKVTFFNNILWNNTSGDGSDLSENELHTSTDPNSRFYIDYNLIKNLTSNQNYNAFGDYNISVDPGFMLYSPPAGQDHDFSISSQSLAIGAGTSSFESASAPTTDILGNARPNPAGSNPDMGAYEHSLAKSPYPKQVQNLTAIGGSGQITLNWDALADADADSVYKVYKHTSAFSVSETYYVGATSAKTSPHETTYKITGLDNATRYYFRVTAVNKEGYEGTPSKTIDITPSYSGPVWWVSTAGNDDNEGSSGSPFASISKAVEKVAKGDTVMLKEGTYTGTNNREITFNHDSPEIVIKSEKGAEKTIIDAGNIGQRMIFKFHRPNNASSDDRLDSTFQIIGLQFTGATRSAIWVDRAGTDDKSTFLQPKFSNCIFYNNRNTENNGFGGAVLINNGSPIFESCVFDSNYVNGSGGAIGIRSDLATGRRTHIRSSTFTNNMSYSSQNVDPAGSAIMITGDATATIVNSIFENNISETSEQNVGGKGAIVTDSDWNSNTPESDYILIIDRCVIKNNTIIANANTYGAGLYIGDPARITNNLIVNNEAITTGNQQLGTGVWVGLESRHNNNGNEIFGRTYIINNTIANNIQKRNGNLYDRGAGLWFKDTGLNGEVWFFNNVIWGNESEQQKNINDNLPGSIYTAHNDIQFSSQNPWFDETTMYDVDPVFVDSANGNYKLSDASPVIGAGDAEFSGESAPNKDLLGNSRPAPSGSSPDLGAYENILSESPYPKEVKNVTATIGSQVVNLSWDANIETDIEKYLIYMSETYGFEPTSEDNIGESATSSFSATGLTNSMEYYFRVAAVDSNGYRGAFSQEISAIPEYKGPVWWVDDVSGSDFGDGSSFNPLLSISSAVTMAAAGDTIKLLPGNYGNDNLNTNILLDKSISIIGVGGPDQTIIDANGGSIHFEMNGESVIVRLKGIQFTNGYDNNNQWGGSLYVIDIDSLIVTNCIFTNNFSNQRSGVMVLHKTESVFRNVDFINNGTGHNNDDQSVSAGVFNVSGEENDKIYTAKFIECIFENNGVNTSGSNSGGSAGIFEQHIGGRAVFIDSQFKNNYVRATGSNSWAEGSILKAHHGNIQSYEDFPTGSNQPYLPTVFNRCVFKNNYLEANGGKMGILFNTAQPLQVINCLFVDNYAIGNNDAEGLFRTDPSTDANGLGPTIEFTHNTIANNNGIAEIFAGRGFQASISFTNNIIWDNSSPNLMVNINDGNVLTASNNILDPNTQGDYGSVDNINLNPKFKNPSSGNYQLSNNSPAIDAGLPNEIKVDYRSYYRVGTPDIGAYESGASKYFLTMADDITEDKDTTFVKLDQELKITVTTGDIDGNLVSSNESMSWNIFPNQKYVKFISGDTDTEGGNASATFQVTDQDRGKGFRFRIEAGVGEAFMRSGIYVIEELVTGAPPPVSELTISPSDWTNQPNFTLNWKTPTWAAQRDLIGAVVEITDGVNVYNEYMGFPSGDTLTNYSFTAPEAGQYDASLWLIDELGNEDKDSSMSVTAYFDNVMPETFQTYNPKTFGPDVFYSPSDKPRFEWDDMGDYPSGIKHWDIYTWQNGDQHKYGTYTRSDITFDSNNPNRVYINGSAALTDGYYDWWAVAIDSASNATHSDTAHFGVDLSPPHISHSSPLGTIDAGSTTPTINVNITDGASGVKYANLHYRRSGSGGGFVTLDLMSGPVSIPGSDVKEDGLEYWIDAEDNVDNYDAWPGIGELHAVSVRSEGSITTADNWSNGVPGGTDSTNYLFFSIPFEVGNAKSAITSMMGPPDEFNYRLFSYNNGWQEDPPSVTMGNAYFFIFDPDKYAVEGTPTKIEFSFGQGTSTPTDPPYGIGVSSGQWKFFGSPYNYNVPLDNVYTEDDENIRDAGSIYTWSGSWSNPGSSLLPWKGYIFKSGGATSLNIDARGSGFGKMAKAMNTDDYPMDGDEWIIDMIATTGNARDELNAVGVRNMAEDGYDRLDEFEPPAVMGDIVLRIDNRDREETPDLYAKDIRKPNETGHYWDLQVFTPTNGGRTYLTFDGLGYIPEEYDIFLINKTTKQAKNLEWESSYRFANTGSESYLKQDLRLVIGTKDYVKENNAGVELYPDAFTLSQNYPNPFNPQTSIMISLEEDAQLNLIIFNLLGEEVTRLAMNEHRPAGYYTFIWNGTNAMGSKVSTGVYFYHAMIRDAKGKVVLNKTRKMIFLK